MRRITSSVIALVLAAFVTLSAAEPANPTLIAKASRAVGLLYSQDEGGTMRMLCTATNFEDAKGGYHFVTAAHCVGEDKGDKAADYKNTPFFITFDEREQKVFYRATVVGVGYQHRGDDFAEFFVPVQDKTWPSIPLGDEKKLSMDEPPKVINVASPLGLGKQVFRGSITNLFLDRPVVQGDINWSGTMLLQIQAGPGSSGSAIISEDQQAIVGFLVGSISGNIVAIPVSRFHKFRKAIKDGTYKWSPDADGDQ